MAGKVAASQGSVLVLDMIADEAEMYAEYLRASGYDVQVCHYPEEALQAIARQPPDVFVTRLRQATPGVNGIDVVRRLKQDGSTAALPVVMITTSILREDRRAAAAAKCDSYLLLPVVPEQLAAEIRRLIAGRPSQ